MRRRLNVLLICTCNLSSSTKITPAQLQQSMSKWLTSPNTGHQHLHYAFIIITDRTSKYIYFHEPHIVWLCKTFSAWQFDNIIPGIESHSPRSMHRRKKRDKKQNTPWMRHTDTGKHIHLQWNSNHSIQEKPSCGASWPKCVEKCPENPWFSFICCPSIPVYIRTGLRVDKKTLLRKWCEKESLSFQFDIVVANSIYLFSY